MIRVLFWSAICAKSTGVAGNSGKSGSNQWSGPLQLEPPFELLSKVRSTVPTYPQNPPMNRDSWAGPKGGTTHVARHAEPMLNAIGDHLCFSLFLLQYCEGTHQIQRYNCFFFNPANNPATGQSGQSLIRYYPGMVWISRYLVPGHV